MNRRDLIRTVGTAAALSILPRDAEAAWARIIGGERAAGGLGHSRMTLVSSLADTIIPRTDTPGATDVGVQDWVELIVTDYYRDDERDPFLAGLDDIDARCVREAGAPFAELSADARNTIMQALDVPADRTTVDARAYARLKGLVIHGYFTSEEVQREVLKTQVIPGRFDGAAPMQVTGRGS